MACRVGGNCVPTHSCLDAGVGGDMAAYLVGGWAGGVLCEGQGSWMYLQLSLWCLKHVVRLKNKKK